MGGHRLVGGEQGGIQPQPQRLGRSGAQAVQVFPALAQGLDGLAVGFWAELGRVAVTGLAGQRGGQGQAGQRFGLVHQVFTRPATTPLLPALEAAALGLQGLAALLQAVRQGVASGAGQRVVNGLQPGLQAGQLALGCGGLGLLQQAQDGLALCRAGRRGWLALGAAWRRVGLGRAGLGRRGSPWWRRQGRCIGPQPLRKALVQLARQAGIGQWRQGLPARQG